jgi:hypothetical protein
MPKSKKRKTRYVPKSRPVQQPLTTTAQPVERTTEPVRATAPQTTTVKVKSMAGKVQAIPQPTNITTELKIMGSISALILVAIVLLYFAFR